jgi:hypothetical protein
MSVPRRTIIRPAVAPLSDVQRRHQLDRLRTKLEAERTSLVRWQSRLRRAFKACEKHQRAVARLERRIRQVQENHDA